MNLAGLVNGLFAYKHRDLVRTMVKSQYPLHWPYPLQDVKLAEQFYEQILKLVKLHAKNGGTIVDIGCGTGRLTLDCARLHGMQVIGIDNMPPFIWESELIAQGRRQDLVSFIPKNPCRFLIADAAAMPFPENFADLVLFVNVIDRVSDPYAVVHEIHRITKPGGHIIFADPYDWNKRVSAEIRMREVDSWFGSDRFTIPERSDALFVVPTGPRRAVHYRDDVAVIRKS